MRFATVSTYPVGSRQNLLEWKLEEATDPGDYLFWVDRANSPEGPWDRLTPIPLVNAFYFVDRKTVFLSKEPHVYYRVIVRGPLGDEKTSNPVDLFRALERKQFLVAREMIRKEILRFRKFVGIPVQVLKLKHYGTPCSKCIDPVSGYQLDSMCLCCFGTRWEGGYEPPIKAWVERGPMDDNKGLGGSGWMTEDFEGQVRMVAYPIVTREDVLVEASTNVRLRVLRVSAAELRGAPIVQIVTARFIPRSEIEYRVSANVEKEALFDPYSCFIPKVQPEGLL